MEVPSRRRNPPFISRVAEQENLSQRLIQLGEGVGGSVRICGNAGVGKTRLTTEALAQTSIPVAWGAADEAERGRPLAALADALGIDRASAPSNGDRADRAGDATWLAIDRLLDAVDERTRQGPLVLVLDDLQWSDHDTWLAAGALSRRAAALGLLLISIHRPLPPSKPAPVPLASLGDVLELAPLHTDDALALATSVLGRPVDDEIAEQIGRGAGNPFFTIEIARWVRDLNAHGQTPASVPEAGLPPELRAAVLNRVDTLSPTTLGVLRSAALVGRRTTVVELSTLTSQTVDSVAASIEEATVAGLLVDRPDGVSFRHDLVRAAVRAETPPAVVAAHVQLVTEDRAADPWAAKLLAAQTEPGDVDAAQIVLASARAPNIAPEVAAELLGEVLRIGPPPEVDAAAVETELVVSAARCGDLEAAVDLGQRLLENVGDGFDRSELRRQVAGIDLGCGRVDVAIAALQSLAAGEGTVATRARGDLYLAEVITVQRPDAVDDARHGRRHVEDPTARCTMELAVAVHAMRTGHLDESVEAATAAVAQAALEPLLTAEIHPEVFLANALFYAERFEEAAQALDQAQRAATRAGVVWPIPHHLAHIAGAALRTGDLEGARTASREAIEWSLDTNHRIGATWPQVFLTAVAVHTGELDEARASLAAAELDLEAGQWQGTEAVPWAAALVAEAEGDSEAAANRLVPMVELAHGFEWNNRLALLAPTAARMAWTAGRHDAVTHVADLFESVPHLTTIEARAGKQRCRALADDDVDALIAAARLYERVESRTHAGTTWAEAAVVAARTGDHDRGQSLFAEEARPRLEAIGADGVLTMVLAACPVRLQRRLGRQRPRPTEGVGALTPAERRIAEQVATGATNTQIAEELVVSRRTVESHLSRVYRKLGITSRVRLATVDLS